MKEINPIRRIRTEKRLTVFQLGFLANVTGTRISQIENGEPMKLPKKILEAVKILGYDPEQIQAEYQAWREAKRQALLKAIKQ